MMLNSSFYILLSFFSLVCFENDVLLGVCGQEKVMVPRSAKVQFLDCITVQFNSGRRVM